MILQLVTLFCLSLFVLLGIKSLQFLQIIEILGIAIEVWALCGTQKGTGARGRARAGEGKRGRARVSEGERGCARASEGAKACACESATKKKIRKKGESEKDDFQ